MTCIIRILLINMLSPRTQDGAEEQEIDEMVACFNRPDLEAVTREQLVGQAGRRDKTQPEHKGSRRA